jgi:hypothetical protein
MPNHPAAGKAGIASQFSIEYDFWNTRPGDAAQKIVKLTA